MQKHQPHRYSRKLSPVAIAPEAGATDNLPSTYWREILLLI